MKKTNKAKTDTAKTLTGKQKVTAKKKTATLKNGVSKAQVSKEARADEKANKPVALKGATPKRLIAIIDGVNGAVTALDAMIAIYIANGLTVKSEAKAFSTLNKVLKAKLISEKGSALSEKSDVQFRNLARSAKASVIPAKPKKKGSSNTPEQTASQKTQTLKDHRTSINGLDVQSFAKHIKSEMDSFSKKNDSSIQDVLDALIKII